MSTPVYEFGSLVKVYTSTVFKDAVTLVAADPDVVSFSVRSPDDVSTTYVYGTDAEVQKVTTGSYYIEIDTDQHGVWYVGIFSDGSGQAADELRFEVKAIHSRAE